MTIITIKTLIVTIIMFTNAENKRRACDNRIKPMIVTSHPNITNFEPHQSNSDAEK
jgi:hypothetical protein